MLVLSPTFSPQGCEEKFQETSSMISEHWTQNIDPYEYDTSVITTTENN
jgi:hypothetical protein